MKKDYLYSLFLGLNLTVSIIFTFWYFLIISFFYENLGVIYAICVLVVFSLNILLFLIRKKTKGFLKVLVSCCFALYDIWLFHFIK
jgi:hypothetical protein